MAALVETMMYSKEGGVPWHGLGNPVDGAQTGRAAIVAAGLDWGVEKCPLFARMTINGKATSRKVDDRFAMVRVSDQRIMGIVTNDYVVLQNMEAFEIIDAVMAEVGVEAKYETAGALRGGKEIFLSALLPNDILIGKGDRQMAYLMLRTGHDGYTALDILPTMVRPVCWNTVTLALRNRRDFGGDYTGTTLWHMGDIESKIAAAKAALNLSIKRIDDYVLTGNKLVEVAATDAMVNAFIALIIPAIGILPAGRISSAILPNPRIQGAFINAVPADMFDRAVIQRDNRVSIFRSVWAEEASKTGANAWALFNAATGYADHAKPYNRKSGETAMISKLYNSGANWKQDALESIQALTLVN